MKQIGFNLTLIDQADGLLAPATGRERYLTVATSHTAGGCKSILAKCKSYIKKMTDGDGMLSYEKAAKDKVFKSMLDKGWTFLVIPASVEWEFPMLPNIAQQALNASSNVANQTNELEVAMTIATMADSQSECGRGDFNSCVENAAAAAPPCKDYIQTIGKYVKDYAGGKGAPLIVFLDFVGKKYGSQKLLGKDFSRPSRTWTSHRITQSFRSYGREPFAAIWFLRRSKTVMPVF